MTINIIVTNEQTRENSFAILCATVIYKININNYL